MAETTSMIPVAPATGLAELQGKTSEELRSMLAEQLKLTAGHLLRLAWIVRVLEERGEDLSDLKLGLLPYLRQIAHGQVVPEAVVRFASSPMLLGRVAALPTPDQQRLAAGETVKLVVPAPDGQGYTHRAMAPERLTRDQISQVFARTHIRAEAEQIAILEDRRAKPLLAAKASPPRGKARADRARGGLVVGRTFVAHADVIRAMADLREGGIDDGAERQPLVVQLTPEEHRRLKVRAAEGDATMSDLVRLAMRAAGLI